MNKKKPTVAELFAGAGIFGSDLAKEKFSLVSAIELDPIASESYRRNLGEHVITSDIRIVTPTGRADVLIAGPPCQGFSSLGKRDESDVRNNLSLQVLKWMDVLRPKVIVIENVPQFLKSPQACKIASCLESRNYLVTTIVLDSYDYGVPQHRTRGFLLASKVGELEVLEPRKKVSTVKESWIGLAEEPDGINHHELRVPTKLAADRIRLIPPGGDKRDLINKFPRLCPPSWHKTRNEVTDIWGRMKFDAPSNTLRTCFLNPSKGRYLHPEQDRVISIREGARIQTIPDSYQFAGSPYQIAKQIGNSVPFTLGRCIARAVYRNVA